MNIRNIVWALVACWSFVAMAAGDSDNNPNDGLNVSVQLKHRVVIPEIIYFRIGLAAEISKVEFNLLDNPSFTAGNNRTQAGKNPLGNGTPIAATSENAGVLALDLRANVGTVILSYAIDNPSGLSDGSGHFIPMSEVTVQTDNAGFPAPILTNLANNTASIVGNLYAGKVIKQTANWTYTYKNTVQPLAGRYKGRVTYIASAP